MNNIKTCKQGNTSTHQNDLNRSPSDCPPDLCGACRQITLDRLLVTRERRAPIPSPWEDSGPVREAVFLEVHLDTPEKSTQTCPMCKLMHDAVWGGLECPGPTTVKLCMTDERRVVNVLNPSKAGVETRPGLMSPGSNELPQSGPPGLLAGSPNPEGLGKYVSIFADHDTHASQFLPGREIGRPGSDCTFMSIQRWINECNDNHPRCRYGITGVEVDIHPKMPTRVLDVGSPDGAQPARLLVTQGRHDCYLALSHRWGPHDFVTTTKSVLESYKQSIDLTTLPKTYQDAAVVVRKLGFRFIWIDSLCIVQDDEDDWNREAKTMGLVYQNAHFTIAASHALSDHEGFLFPREIEPFVVRLPCESENPDLGNMYFRTNNVPAFGQGLAPLNQRGWVLQEYTLSRRIICFTRDQVYWHCHQYLLGEDGNKEDTSTFINTSDRLSQSLKLHRQPKIDDATGSLTSVENSRQYESSSLSAALYVFWASKIQSYSRCALTYPQDKLPAVLGLATEIQQAFNLQYIDGHWFFEHPLFTYSLLWYAEESLVRPAMTRCPSWSWAAMDGPIIFHFYSLDLEVRRKVVLNVLKVLASERFGLHPYRSLFMKGHIRAAARSTKWLRGRGSRRPSLLMNNNDNIQAPTRRCYGILNPSDPRYGLSNAQNCVGWVCFDTNAVEPETFFCIAVCEREGSAYPDYTFRDCPVIIVVSVTGGAAGCGSEYSRIGIGAVTGLDWFNDGDDDNKNNSDEVFTLI